jgi:hypothetical protein
MATLVDAQKAAEFICGWLYTQWKNIVIPIGLPLQEEHFRLLIFCAKFTAKMCICFCCSPARFNADIAMKQAMPG